MQNLLSKLLKVLGLLFFSGYLSTSALAQQTVQYKLVVRDTLVNFADKNKRVLSINGEFPMPTLEFTEGDLAEITVVNQSSQSTSLHWHGVHVPNDQDGVPFLTQNPILPGDTFTYRFPIKQNGTHWYHSHSGFQEQDGLYGMFIMHKKKDDPHYRKGIDDLPTIPVILSEWTNLKPQNIQRMLHFGTDWFEIKKGSTQSYAEAIRSKHFKTKLLNEWKRMNAMDVSDIYYEKFLINGSPQRHYPNFKAKDRVRLRIANGGSSSYFWLQYAGGKITVVANDGNDVEPTTVDRLLIGVSETYDIIVSIPQDEQAFELRATPEDRSGSASLFLGQGTPKLAPVLPKLAYFKGMEMMNNMMKTNGEMKDMDMDMSFQTMDMNQVMYPEIHSTNTHSGHGSASANPHEEKAHSPQDSQDKEGLITLNYGMLKSPTITRLPKGRKVKEVYLELTGNMNRYVWSMNNKVLSEVDKIKVEKGEILRLVLYNNSMMRHPMHLHGYDFRILNGQKEYAPLKNVMDIMPMEKNVIEFVADQEGDWFFHCHILYHMMGGMNQVFDVGDYQNSSLPDRAKTYKKLQRSSNMIHLGVENDFATNGNDGKLALENTRWSLTSEWRLGYNREHGYEFETHLGRYIDKNQWFMPFIGVDWRYKKSEHHGKNLFGQNTTKNKRAVVSMGFNYTLPLLMVFQAEAFHNGKVRLQLSREDIPISKRIRGDFMVNTDKEYAAGLQYILGRNFGVRIHYDSDMKWGAGLAFRY